MNLLPFFGSSSLTDFMDSGLSLCRPVPIEAIQFYSYFALRTKLGLLKRLAVLLSVKHAAVLNKLNQFNCK